MRNNGKRQRQSLRMILIFVFVVLFMAFVVLFVFDELGSNNDRISSLYYSQSQDIVNYIGKNIELVQSEDDSDENLQKQLSELLEASGDRFLVMEDDAHIIFAKSQLETDRLYDLTDPGKYWSSINISSYDINTYKWEHNNVRYSLSLLTDHSYLLETTALSQHIYYVMIAVVLLCLVLLILLITYVGILNRTETRLSRTEMDLTDNNRRFEKFIDDNSSGTESQIKSESEFEKRYNRFSKINDVAVLRNLLSKSDDEDLKPIRILIITFALKERYYTADEIFRFVELILSRNKNREFIAELRKGCFAIILYKSSEAEAKAKAERVLTVLEKNNDGQYDGFDINLYELGASKDTVLEDFERIMAEEVLGK